MANALRHEFTFVVEGIELSPEQQEQLSRAVRQAGMNATASWDLGGDRIAVPLPLGVVSEGGGSGGTQGAALAVLRPAAVKRLLSELRSQDPGQRPDVGGAPR